MPLFILLHCIYIILPVLSLSFESLNLWRYDFMNVIENATPLGLSNTKQFAWVRSIVDMFVLAAQYVLAYNAAMCLVILDNLWFSLFFLHIYNNCVLSNYCLRYINRCFSQLDDSDNFFEIAEFNCWQEWLVFSDIFYFLVKSGCIDFIDFVDKLVSRLTEGDQQIVKTNHVTWLFAQIIRIEMVMTALNTDARKVVLDCKSIAFILPSLVLHLLSNPHNRFLYVSFIHSWWHWVGLFFLADT